MFWQIFAALLPVMTIRQQDNCLQQISVYEKDVSYINLGIQALI